MNLMDLRENFVAFLAPRGFVIKFWKSPACSITKLFSPGLSVYPPGASEMGDSFPKGNL